MEVVVMSVSDLELIQCFLKGGDKKAFTEIVNRYERTLKKYATRLCNGDSYLAEDVVQETFLRAFISLATFREEAKLSTWLHSIAFNCSMAFFRKNKMQICCLDEVMEVVDVRQDIENIDVGYDLENALNSIATPQQNVFYICVVDGYSHEQAAAITGMPLGTVKTNVRRTKHKLQEYLNAWAEAA
jgi:RNA polymerase sigma-70 factor, ECF subfamily